MSNPPGINSRNNRVALLQSSECNSGAPARQQADVSASKIERGIRLNPMQKDFLTKFENMRRDARDLPTAFTQHALASNTKRAPCGLVPVKKISEK